MRKVTILAALAALCMASVLSVSVLSASESVKVSAAFNYNGRTVVSPAAAVALPAKAKGYASWRKTAVTPDDKIEARLDGKTYDAFPVTEYTVSLVNVTDGETGIVDDFRSLDITIPFQNATGGKVRVHMLAGSHCGPDDFVPSVTELAPGQEKTFATPSGRSSNEVFPFIEVCDDSTGYVFAVGWTGGWQARIDNEKDGHVHVRIGMTATHFKMLPKEKLAQPGIVVFKRENMSRMAFKTVIHRFMMQFKVPRDAKGDVISPILAVACGGGNKTPKMMQQVLDYAVANKMPFDTYWIDAGWYGAPHEDEHFGNCGPNWPKYVGDWRVNTTTHPTGTLKPIADAVHKAGLKLLLWFEPERVAANMPIRAEHPDYIHANLLDLGNPEALKWIQHIVYGMIETHGIDVYRQDFNTDPGPVWRQMDKERPDRVGVAEIRHITGMYKLLDDMRKRFPNILQENCASGGRRIDIEMISRAHTYCRSDYFIGQKPEDKAFLLGQNSSLNLSPYLPFQGCEFNCVPVGDDYGAFSIIASGTVITPSDFDRGIVGREFSERETDWFKKVFAVAARMKTYYMGDFFPLTEERGLDNAVWCGWQCDRPENNAGFAIVFRRADAKSEKETFRLGGIDPEATYELEYYDGVKKEVKGAELAAWTVTLKPRAFALVFYKKK